ncbi:MAG: oligosaccharide flippase family protein [Candidatus Magasanikbacteria bacterium]
MANLGHQVIKNSIYSFIGFIWPILLAFIATPLLIRGLGSAKFGYYILLNASVAFFALLDFGLSYTFIKKLSEEPENAGNESVKKLFSSTFWAYLVIGLLVFLLLCFLPNLFNSWFRIPDGYAYSHQLIFFCLGLTFLFKMLSVTIGQIPYALQRSDITTKVALLNVTLVQVASVILVLTGHGIASLVIVQLFSSVIVFLLYFFISRSILPNLKLEFYFSPYFFKGIAKDGFWNFIASGAGNLLTQLDKFVVGIFCGSTGVTYYTSSQMIPEKIHCTAFSLSICFFPVFSRASISGPDDGVRKIFRRGFSMVAFVSGGLSLAVLIYNYQLLKYWLGTEIADNASLAVIFLVGTYFLTSLGSFGSFFVSGWRKLKFSAFTAVLMAVLDIIFMFILIPRFQVAGAAAAYLLSVLPIPFFILYIEKNYLKSETIGAIKFYLKHILKMAIVIIPVYLFSVAFFIPIASSLLSTILLGGISFLLYVGIYWLLGFFNPDDISLLKEFMQRSLLKFNLKHE